MAALFAHQTKGHTHLSLIALVRSTTLTEIGALRWDMNRWVEAPFSRCRRRSARSSRPVGGRRACLGSTDVQDARLEIDLIPSAGRPQFGRPEAVAEPQGCARGQWRLDAAKAPLSPTVSFDAIPVRIDHEGSVIARAIVRPQAGCAIVSASRAECGGMERIDRLTRRRSEAKMEI
jgi:hypothetical protein